MINLQKKIRQTNLRLIVHLLPSPEIDIDAHKEHASQVGVHVNENGVLLVVSQYPPSHMLLSLWTEARGRTITPLQAVKFFVLHEVVLIPSISWRQLRAPARRAHRPRGTGLQLEDRTVEVHSTDPWKEHIRMQ